MGGGSRIPQALRFVNRAKVRRTIKMVMPGITRITSDFFDCLDEDIARKLVLSIKANGSHKTLKGDVFHGMKFAPRRLADAANNAVDGRTCGIDLAREGSRSETVCAVREVKT